MKPRDLVFDRLAGHKAAVITFTAPLTAEEQPFVFSMKGKSFLQLQVEPTRAIITNTSGEDVPFCFSIVPKKYAAIITADWRALAAFVQSIQRNLLTK